MKQWLYLGIAIITEVIGTSALKPSHGFTKPVPSVLVIAGYALSFYYLSLTLKTMPVGIAYAVWSGVGVALIVLIGWILYDQKLDFAAVVGILFIVAGVMILNFFSNTKTH